MTVAVVAATSMPYLYGALSTPGDRVYTGLLFDVPDHAQYWSWVTASRAGLWISNTMTPEPNPPIFMNLFMWALAQVQALGRLSFPALFQFWRIAAAILVVSTVWWFTSTMVADRSRRPTAMFIATAGAGFGWVLVVGKYLSGARELAWPSDIYTVEPNTFWAILSYPYIASAQAFILLTLVGAWRASRNGGPGAWVVAVVGAACLGASHAYDLITVYAVLSAYGVVRWVREREVPFRLVMATVAVAAVSLPFAWYFHQLTTSDPLWRAILGQYANAGVWTPPHFHLVLLMGAPLLMATLSFLPGTGWSEERRFVAVWAVLGFVLIYLPVVYQIKLLSGWQFPLAILAAHAWHERILPAMARVVSTKWAVAMLVTCMAATNGYLFAWRFIELRRHSSPYYLNRDDAAALAWIAVNTGPDDVVIAPAEIGQFIPNYGRSRSYLAHWAMTNRFFERRANVERFFDGGTPDSWRAQLLAAESITVVCRCGSAASPDQAGSSEQWASFETVFEGGGARVLRARTGAPQAAMAAVTGHP